MAKKIKWRTEYNILIILALVFGGIFALTGIQEFPDTVTYVEMYLGREPVYPLFLAACRMVFGEAFSFLAAVVIQNILAIAAVYFLVITLKRIFELQDFWLYAVLFLSLSPFLLSPLGSSAHMTLENGLISEGLTYPLYYFLVGLFFKIIFGERRKGLLLGAYGITLLLTLTRGQMLPLLLVWAVVSIYFCLRHKEGKKILLIFAAVIFGFLLRSGLFAGYNFLLHGTTLTSNNANTTFFTNVLYSADKEDGMDIQDELLREYFDKMYQKMEEAGWNRANAGKMLTEQIDHHEDSHDKIKFDIAELYITWYINEETDFAYTGYAREALKEETAAKLTASVLPNCLFSWIQTYLYVAVGGFVRTIAILHPLFNIYALLGYGTAVVLMLYLFKKDRKSKAALFMLTAFLLICANVFATAMTIMCLSRYMIYNMPVFYIAGLMMLKEIWEKRRRHGI